MIPREVEFLLHSRVQVGCDSPSLIPYRCCGLLPPSPQNIKRPVCVIRASPNLVESGVLFHYNVSFYQIVTTVCDVQKRFFFLLYPSSWSKTFLKSDLLPSSRDGEQVRCVVWWVLGPKWPFLQSHKIMRVSVLSHLQAEARKLCIIRRRAKCRTRERRTYNVIKRRVR